MNMIDIFPTITAFAIVFMAELGDKTQLTVMMLSSKGSARSVFFGAMLAFLIVDGVSLLIGDELLSFIPYDLIGAGAGLLFIIIGALSLIRRRKERNRVDEIESRKADFLKTFSIIALMELGDKTQLACVVLAAELGNPLGVLAGVMLGFSAVTAIGVISGTKILRILPRRYLEIGAAFLFILLGILFILDAASYITLVPHP